MTLVPLIQQLAVAAFAAFVLFGVAMPVGARFGARTGRRLQRGTLVALLVAVVALFARAASSGDLALANATFGTDEWLQFGGFFFIMLFVVYNFGGKYLDDRAREEAKEARDA